MSWPQSAQVRFTQACFLTMNSVATLTALGFLLHNIMKKIVLCCSYRDLRKDTLGLISLATELHDPESLLNLAVLHTQDLGLSR